jgi:hypothetical protein
MSGKILSMTDRLPEGGYYNQVRYTYALSDYVSARDLGKFLWGVSLISAAPFFYLLITHDVMPCVVFMLNAAAGAGIGAWSFKKTCDREQPRRPAGNVPRVPSVARRGLKAA